MGFFFAEGVVHIHVDTSGAECGIKINPGTLLGDKLRRVWKCTILLQRFSQT